MNRTVFAYAVGLLSLISWSETILTGGGFIPDLQPQDAAIRETDGASMRLRKPHDLLIAPGADGVIDLTIGNSQVTTNDKYVDWTLYAPDGAVVDSGKLPVSKSVNLKRKASFPGLYRLHLDANGNSARVSKASGICCVKTDFEQPFHSIFECPRLYFLTCPSSDGKAHLDVWGENWEVCGVKIWDADGKEIYTGSLVTPEDRQIRLSIALPVPKDQLGRPWSIQLTDLKHARYRFEDMYILPREGTVPALALKPSALAIPATQRVIAYTPKGEMFVGMELTRQLMEQKDVTAEFVFEYGMDGKVEKVYRDSARSGDGKIRVGLTVKRGERAIGHIRCTVKDSKGKLIAHWDEMIFILGNKLFNEVIREEDGTPAQPTAADTARGFQIFQREEPGFVRRYSRPNTAEVIAELTGECSPGMVSTECFALQPLKAFDAVTLSVSDLTGPSGAVIPASCIGLFSLKPHLQRVEYNSGEVIDIPEVLDKNVTVPLSAKVPQLFCVQTTVSAKVRPGVYRGTLMLNGKAVLPYCLTVDDFELPEDPAMSFGLYPDTERWIRFNYTDEQIMAELKYFRDYGLTALLMYPMLTAKLSWDGKALTADLTEFRKQVKMLKAAGFYGVMVVDLQIALKEKLPQVTGIGEYKDHPDLWKAFGDLLTAIRNAAVEDNWPRYCIHTTDEPSGSNLRDMAIQSLKFAHDMNFKTFNTCYGEFVRSNLDPFLDYRCYNNVCYHSFPTEDKAIAERRDTLLAGDEFWWYGSGCYCNGNFLEDGNIYTNRQLLGIFNWRLKATGAWSWTFWRSRGNQYDDFDSSKDECMAYQDMKNNTIISTLQWEGAREGIYDHRYLVLWENTVTAAKTRPALAKMAADSEKRIRGYLATIGWSARNFAVGNGQLRKMRKMLIEEITALNKALK